MTDSTIDGLLQHLTTGLTLHLFVNDHEPAPHDTVADYEEATFPGYAPMPLDRWDADGLTRLHPECVFTLADDLDDEPEYVCGWYIECGGVLQFAGRVPDDPKRGGRRREMRIARSKIKVTPTLRTIK